MWKYAVGVAALTIAGACPAQVPPEKQALVDRVLAKLPVESVGVAMLQAPVADALRQARAVIQGRVPADKQDAILKDITADATKFMQDNLPVVRANTQAAVKTTVAPLLASKFSEEELKQLAALLESPVKAKLEAVLPELQNALGESVAKSTQAEIKPKMAALQEQIGKRMQAAVTP